MTGGELSLEGVTAALNRHRPDAVLHFAAFALVGESVAKPELYYRNNFVGSLNLLQAMVAAEVTQLVIQLDLRGLRPASHSPTV